METPVKPCLLPQFEKKRIECPSCDRSFSTRFGLNRHRKKCHSSLGDPSIVKQEEVVETSKQEEENPVETSKQEEENHVVTHVESSTQVEATPKRRKRNFISIHDFNRYACQQPIKWSDLPRDCIYKLEWVNAEGEQIAANLTSRDGVTKSVLLPKFVVDRLLAITESDIIVYVRPQGEDQVDIVTPKKHTCKNCGKEMASRGYLERHLKRCS